MHAPTSPNAPSPALLAALRRALAPLVRLLIARAIPFPAAAEILKDLYVDVANRDFPVDGKPQTDSRIHLLTGVHRKDVRRLRATSPADLATPKRVSLATQIISRWTTESVYRDDAGVPRLLPRASAEPEVVSFESLVRSLNTDIRPRVVLDELVRLGVVELAADDHVCLRADAFVPESGSDELAFFFGRNLHDHAAAAVHNLLGGEPRFLERSVAYNHLPEEAVEELATLARQLGMAALQQVNARAMTLQKERSGTPGADRRINFGLYFFSRPEADATTEEEPE